jgi:hypothetical protein
MKHTPNAHSKSTIWGLLKEIFKLIITIGNLGISYIEDWSRVLLKSAIDSRDTKVIDDVGQEYDPTELEESVERAEYFVDEVDKDWQRDMEQDWNGGITNGVTNSYLDNTIAATNPPIYDGVYDDDNDSTNDGDEK